jgi:hypothetical protein
MALESATYINNLVDTNPSGADSISQGDDHIRLIKKVLKNTFPSVASATAPVLAVTHKAESNTFRPPSDDTYANTGMTVTHTKLSPTSTLYIQFDCFLNIACNYTESEEAKITGYLGGSGSPATIITGTTADLVMILFEDPIDDASITWDATNTFSRTFKVTAAACPDGTSGPNTFVWVYKMNKRGQMDTSNKCSWAVWEVED